MITHRAHGTTHRIRLCLRQLIILALLLPMAAVAGRTLPWSSDDDIVGQSRWVMSVYEDTFASIGEDHGFGFLELVRANPDVDPWLPGDDTRIRLPTRHILPSEPREGIVINLAEYRLYHFRDGRVDTYPVGIGNTNNPSPLTTTEITMRLEQPAWYPPESIRKQAEEDGDPLPRMIPPGPANPLGPYALQLAERGYLIHGTNRRFGIGQQVSHGCIRMYNEDISQLVWEAEKGTQVRIVEEPVKIGIENDLVWLQIHGQREELTEEDRDELWREAEEKVSRLKQDKPRVEINRSQLDDAVEAADGIPRRIGEILDQVPVADR